MNRNGKLTIRDIAAIAGVSAGTVSRVVNAQAGVGDATRQRIQEVIAQHNFRIDPTARQLSTGRSHTLAVVFPLHASEMIMHPVYPALLGALGDSAERAGYDLLLLTMSSQKVAHVVETVVRRRVDGIVLPAASPRDPLIKELIGIGAPTVLIGHRSSLGSVGWVDCTHDVAAHDLTKLMLAGGRNDLVLLNGPQHVSACRLRSAGFWRGVKEAGDRVRSAREVHVPFDTTEAAVAAAKILADTPRPTGVVCGSDIIAVGVLDTARSLGLHVPDDLAISGFDDRSFASHTSPSLTTVRMPLYDTGSAAAQMLFSMLGDAPKTPRKVVLPTEIILRESTPPPGM